MNKSRAAVRAARMIITGFAALISVGTASETQLVQAQTRMRGIVLQTHQQREGEIVKGALGVKLDEYVRRFEAVGFSGVLLVAKDGEIVLQRGYGYAERTRRTPVTSATVFDILSITKQFTAAAILKLEMQEKLSINDSLTKFFDNVPEDKRAITLHHLLTHSAGFARDSGGDYDEMSRDALIRWAFDSELHSPPGRRYSYSNVGYSLLAAVIEKASGQKYEDYLRESLFKPAGMRATGYKLPNWKPNSIAHGYRGDEDWGKPNEKAWAFDAPYWNLRGNGGILSNAPDMYQWHLALEGNSVLSEDAKRKLFTPYISEDPDDPKWQGRYAYGWAVRPTPRGTRLITHTGRNPYFYADLMRFVDDNIVIFLAANSTDFQLLAAQIPRIIFGTEDALAPPQTVLLKPNSLAQYAGTYQLPSGAEIVVSADNGGLKVTGNNQESLLLTVPGRSADDLIVTRLNERTVRLLKAASVGSFQSLNNQSDGRVLENLASEWREWLARFGKFTTFELVGTYPRGKIDHTTVVRVVFERHSLFLHFLWGQDEEIVLDAIITGAKPVTKIYPVSDTNFVSYDMRLPSSQSLRVRFDKSVSGTATLTVDAGGRRVTASKIVRSKPPASIPKISG